MNKKIFIVTFIIVVGGLSLWTNSEKATAPIQTQYEDANVAEEPAQDEKDDMTQQEVTRILKEMESSKEYEDIERLKKEIEQKFKYNLVTES